MKIPKRFRFVQDGEERSIRVQWYRGKHTNYAPNKEKLANNFEKYILHGWLPKEPIIEHNSHIVVLGSCFAREVSNFLSERGYSSLQPKRGWRHDFIDSGVNNTFAIRQLFEWAWQGKEPKEETWYDGTATLLRRDENARQWLNEYFSKATTIILTFGLSEVWYNKQTNDVFWRAVPYERFDENLHGFRVTTVEENKANINATLDLIRQYTDANVIITLSPVPLNATFRPISCLSANTVSKSILRVAIDEVMRDRDVQNNDKLFYWPGYEIVKEYYNDPYQDDGRHVKRETVDFIMEQFSKYYII